MDKLERFKDELEKRRKKSNPDDPYERLTHCNILYKHTDGKEHSFAVRGWGHIMLGKLDIGAVNWTMCAGPVTLTIDNDNIHLFKIVD